MKRILCLLLSLLFLALPLAGCNQDPAGPVTDPLTDPVTEPKTEPKTEPVTEPVTEPLATGPVDPMGEFDIVLGDPVVVYQADEGVQGWGRYQFPNIAPMGKNSFIVSWSDGEDRVGAAPRVSYQKVTMNSGKTWFWAEKGASGSLTTLPMKNGKYFAGFAGSDTVKLDLSDYEPTLAFTDVQGRPRALYFADDFLDNVDAVKNGVFDMKVNVYNPETGMVESQNAIINWPHAPLARYYEDDFYTLSGWFRMSGARNVIATDEGDLYFCTYASGFDSEAETREDAILDNYIYDSVYVFSSEDSGKTWNFLSQISPDEVEPGRDGPSEPKMIQMPDGSFFMLFRTGNNHPLYYVRSTDGCKTWSEPKKFDEFGVYPQLLTLPCGVTLASYGRPSLAIQATSDPTGEVWQERLEIAMTRGEKKDTYTETELYSYSCFYTGMVQLDDNTALFVYSDFWYPNKNGVGVKTILTRTIHIVPKSEG